MFFNKRSHISICSFIDIKKEKIPFHAKTSVFLLIKNKFIIKNTNAHTSYSTLIGMPAKKQIVYLLEMHGEDIKNIELM